MGQCYPDRHSSNYFDGWRSCTPSPSPNPLRGTGHWIQYELDISYAIHQFHFWNINDPETSASGLQEYFIDYSINGTDWTEFGGFTLSEAGTTAFYEGEAGPDMGGIDAKFILITAKTNFDVNEPCFGFAEIKVVTSEANVPLELVKFDLDCKGDKTQLNWAVTNSLNQEAMVLERSSDAKNWQEIYSELPSGLEQHETYTFEYLDGSADFGTNYYRLRLIDYDGSVEYSNVLESSCKEPQIKMEVYPNPTSNFVTIDFFTESGEEMQYELNDIMGRIVKKGTQEVTNGGSKFELDLSGLPVGTFLLTLSQDGSSVKKKIIKIKD
jgi:hypothetical protein